MGEKFKLNFSEFDGKGIRIAIIDSGIDSHYSTKRIINKKDFTNNKIHPGNSINCQDKIGHGTANVDIILKNIKRFLNRIRKLFIVRCHS